MAMSSQFGPEVQARIAEAVRRAEGLSRGEIVPVVVEKSDPYGEVPHRGALLAVALATAAALATSFPLTLGELVLIQVVAGLLGALAARWDPVERFLAGRRTMQEAVRLRALLAFQEHGLARTAEGTGVLVFASLFERQAEIIGDHGIHERMKEGEWERALEALIAGMKAGDPARGFVDAIALCGARLAAHFPSDPSAHPPVNELEDAIRLERR